MRDIRLVLNCLTIMLIGFNQTSNWIDGIIFEISRRIIVSVKFEFFGEMIKMILSFNWIPRNKNHIDTWTFFPLFAMIRRTVAYLKDWSNQKIKKNERIWNSEMNTIRKS